MSSASSGNNNNNNYANKCHFCGQPNCRVRTCPKVEEYMEAGKCAKDQNGRITLPSGGWLPRGVEGMSMAARIDQYHTANPGQLASPRVTSALLEVVESFAYVKDEAEGNEGEEEDAGYARVLANEAAKGKKRAQVPRVVITTPHQQQTSGPAAQPQTRESAPAKPALATHKLSPPMAGKPPGGAASRSRLL